MIEGKVGLFTLDQYFLQIAQCLLEIIPIYCEVIHVDFYTVMGQIRENGQDNPLKGGKGIIQTKRKNPIRIGTPWESKCGFFLIFW